MRLLGKIYVDPQNGPTGELVIYETEDDGKNRRAVVGSGPPAGAIRRVPVHIEVICDTSSVGDALNVLHRIEDQLKSRAGSNN